MTAKVELLTPSGGKVILDPTDTAVDRTLTLPAVAGTVLNTASDIEAQVKTATNATGDAPIFSCRAWVNFNGTGTVAIRASGNVSSITDEGVGRYTVNFTTAMPDADYSVAAVGMRNDSYALNSNPIVVGIQMNTVYSSSVGNNSFAITTHFSTTASQVDPLAVNIAVFR